MFAGFDRGTFEFFMALGFNNNREFFHSNHAWYERSVRAPLRELCLDLAPALLELDPDIEVRPVRVISHINRDLRYSRDKSPYRDYMWLGYHRAGWAKEDCFHFYFDIGADFAHVGAGMYGNDKPWMDALRARIRDDASAMRDILCSDAVHAFRQGGDEYRRMQTPEGLDDELARWYVRKSFFLEHTYAPEEVMTGDLVSDIAARLRSLKPVYDLMYDIRPEKAPPAQSDGSENFRRIAAKAGYAPDIPEDEW